MSVSRLDSSAKIIEAQNIKTDIAAGNAIYNWHCRQHFFAELKAEKYKKFMTKADKPSSWSSAPTSNIISVLSDKIRILCFHSRIFRNYLLFYIFVYIAKIAAAL